MKKEIVLRCCGGKKCPIVTFNKKSITIKDDFGGKVKLTIDQFNMLKKS